ncbi:MAG: 3-oxoacyl-ACP reductase FabG [Clostridia bacterium]|nr:3-oxoacyl-ACP reductase FabG [Clostridia bacterium]
MNKTVLITGASGGIGKALCKQFAKEGCNVVIHYFSSEEKAQALKAELESTYNIKAITFKADMRDSQQIKSFAEAALKEFGSIDVLINNAGVAYFSLFQLSDDRKVADLFDINLMSAMTLTKEILPSMINKHRGRIINISSMWGISGASCEVHYSASKAALIGFTKALAKEVGPSGITVNCIAPGFIDTEMNSCLDEESVKEIVDATPMGRKGTGDDVASLAVYLSKDEAGFITGQTISVDGGFLGN